MTDQENLACSTHEFVQKVHAVDPFSASAYSKVGALLFEMTAAIATAEANGVSKELILETVEPARNLVTSSPFAERIQKWPRGYPGDFDTVEWIVRQENRATPGSIGWIFESHGLAASIC